MKNEFIVIKDKNIDVDCSEHSIKITCNRCENKKNNNSEDKTDLDVGEIVFELKNKLYDNILKLIENEFDRSLVFMRINGIFNGIDEKYKLTNTESRKPFR
ncbi:MAG: hypothetical protein ACOC2U_03285 [bacterium]